MRNFILYCLILMTALFSARSFANDNVLNVYTWAEELPSFVIAQFEKETGIKVNYSTYDTNEVMYSKIRASKNTVYDLIEPSCYYIDRMRKQDMLLKLDKTKLTNFKHIDPFFLSKDYDPHNDYSVPFIWGVTGLFINKDAFPPNSLRAWKNLVDKKYINQLMLLDEPREVFSMALRMLSYSINDSNPDHIKQAYLKLKELMPNVRLFNVDAVASILIDEDAMIGMSWNGDLFKAHLENPKLQFVFPEDGFEIWVDSFAILKNAPHPENAYKFLNFLMRPEIAKAISLHINYSTANLSARNLMPPEIRNNPTLYPSLATLRRGEFQMDMGEKAMALYEKYWEELKMGG